MRVLTVARWYPSHDSVGRGSFVADLVGATASRGVETRVVSFDRVLVRGRLEERDAVLLEARAAFERVATPAALFVTPVSRGAPGVPVARLPVVRRPGSDDAAALIEDHLAVLRPFVSSLVEDWRPDAIHAHTGLPDGIVAAALGRELDIPVVVTEHMSTIEAELADPVARERYRELLEPGVQLLGVSPSLAARVANLLGVQPDRIGVLPNPVEEGSFPLADPTGRDAGVLLWVGSLGEHKGIDVLLRAFALLRAERTDLRLRLIGGERTQGEQARWEALAASLGVASGVTFDGWLARGQVAAAMARAGTFVHPSPSETFGVAAAEAILTGLPVAARRSGGVPWIVELAGGYGRVADGEDPAAFAAAIERVVDGPLPVGAEAARSRLVEAIGAPAVANQAIALYRAGIADVARRPIPRAARVRGADQSKPVAVKPAALPRLLAATGRDQAFGLVRALPVDLQRGLVLIVPAPSADAAAGPTEVAGVPATSIVHADTVPPTPPRPRGHGPLARLRRALWRPAPTPDALLARAILTTARGNGSGRAPVDIVAIDAPAAALVSRLDARRVRLAPGALRWLADRWDAQDGHTGD